MKRAVTLTKIKSNGTVYWVVRWFDPTSGKKKSKSLGRVDQLSERLAQKAASLLEGSFDITPGLRSVGRCMSLEEYIVAFIASKKAQGSRDATVKEYALTARYLTSVIDPKRAMNEITMSDARRFATAITGGELESVKNLRVGKYGKKWKSRTTGMTTAGKYISKARSIFNAAMFDLENEMKLNPFKAVKVKKAKPKQWHKITPAEFWAFYAAAPVNWKIALAIGRLVAMPRGDMARLKWSQIDMGGNIITYDRFKNAVHVVAPICPELHKILSELRGSSMRLCDGHVLPRPLPFSNPGRDMLPICKAAGVAPWADPFHTLRKSCIDDWAKAGYDPATVQKWAGHADIKTTLTFYTQSRSSDVAKAAGQSAMMAAAGDNLDKKMDNQGTKSPIVTDEHVKQTA